MAQSNDDRNGHNFNSTFEYKIDSTGSFEIRTKFSKANSKYRSTNAQASIDEDGLLLNEASSETLDDSDRNNFTNNLNFNKALRSNYGI